MVPEGRVLDGVLSSQGNAAEQNEEEDQVGEDRVIDNAVALEAKSAWGGGAKETLVSKAREAGLGSGPHVLLSRTEVLAGLGSGLFSLQSYCCWVMTTMSPTPTKRHVCTELYSSKALLLTVNF